MVLYRLVENGLNLIDIKVDIENSQKSKIVTIDASFGKDYSKLFGSETEDEWDEDNPIIHITLVRGDDNTEDLLPTDLTEYFGDDDDPEFVKNYKFLDLGLKKDTPRVYQYRLSKFYVFVKKALSTKEECSFFKGAGHGVLCWVLNRIDPDGKSIFPLEADGSSETDSNREVSQISLVNYYKKLGFTTCADVENAPKSAFRDHVCMYSTFWNLQKKCNNRFTGTISDPLREI